jgi:hypothetical protein
MNKTHIGSDFDDFLMEQGIFQDVEATAKEKIEELIKRPTPGIYAGKDAPTQDFGDPFDLGDSEEDPFSNNNHVGNKGNQNQED